MHFTFENVNDVFQNLVSGIADGMIPTVRTSSRVGDVLQIPEPLTITYRYPKQRVLFNQARDANPFFHLFESIWMLAGRNDVAPLAYYNSKIGEIASDNGETFNGAYGHRWRNKELRSIGDDEAEMMNASAPDFISHVESSGFYDQLEALIDHLKRNPNSRRAVLQMWTVEDDSMRNEMSKDVCCNTCVYFSVRDPDQGLVAGSKHPTKQEGERLSPKVLDMTVCNRSNDIVWGTLGANVVHFSFLQEYIAGCLGVEVGVYNQFSNNAHVYVDNFHPKKWLSGYSLGQHGENPETIYNRDFHHVPIVSDVAFPFVEKYGRFVDLNGSMISPDDEPPLWLDPFLDTVAQPMCNAFHSHKVRDYRNALEWCRCIKPADWRWVATKWILKRKGIWESKGGK